MLESKRQLSAIMFTDIVGYTKLMGENSDKALELVRISKEIQKPLVEKFNGHWLKEMGDGVMAKFNSALDAVNCAIQIQRSCRADFEAQLRIGIHLGDITIDNNDIYGDGVNVASRLESLAEPGGILISESVQRAIHGQSGIQAVYLKEVKLKNVSYEVKIYAVSGVGLPKASLSKNGSDPAGLKSKRKKIVANGLAVAVSVSLLIFAVALLLMYFSKPGTNKGNELIQLEIKVLDGMYVAANSNYPSLAITPDGKTLIFAAVVNGQRRLYKRSLGNSAIEPIPGSVNAVAPFISHDGSQLGFFQDHNIMKMSMDGGVPVPVAFTTPMGVNRGAAWYGNDSILYCRSSNDALAIINSAGDTVSPITSWRRLIKQNNLPQYWPEVISEYQTVLFSTINVNRSNTPDIGLLNLKNRTRQRMINGGSFPEYSDGHILFTRNNSLFVTSFDPHKSLGNSQEILLIKNIMNNMNGSAQYAVGGSTLIYLKTNESAEQEYIAWVDRSGKIDTIFSNGRPFFQPTLAPDGNSVAVTNIDGTNQDIHLFNFDSQQFSRITSHPGEDFNPLWSPDGKEMIFGSEIAEDAGESGPGMARISIDSDKLPESLVRSPGFGNWEFPTSWSGDGKWLLFVSTKGAPIGDVEALNLETNERKIIAAQTTVDESAAVFSPDGKWVAYVSNFSGRDEVYVKAFHESTSARQVSVSGGYEPLWSKDGGELFYREKDKMMSISILDQTTMEMSIPKMLFQGPFKDNQGGGYRYNYDVSEDGKRFIMIYRHNMPKPEIIHVVLNWQGLMEQ